MKTPKQNFRTCTKCGWVHMGVSIDHIANETKRFNEYFKMLPKKKKEHYSGPSKIRSYLFCICGAPYWNTRKFKKGDCPDGVTIGPILFDENDT